MHVLYHFKLYPIIYTTPQAFRFLTLSCINKGNDDDDDDDDDDDERAHCIVSFDGPVKANREIIEMHCDSNESGLESSLIPGGRNRHRVLLCANYERDIGNCFCF